MGDKNSSLTRVIPLMDLLIKDTVNFDKFFTIFNKKIKIDYPIIEYRYGYDEKAIQPPRSILKWLVENTDKLKDSEKAKIIADTKKSSIERAKLFSNDENQKKTALSNLEKQKLPQVAWYIFEGYTQPDIYIETRTTIIVGEAKRTEDKLTTETTWLKNRDQLIRHIDAVIDSGKEVYSFLLVENKHLYNFENYSDIEYFKKSLPHRDEKTVKKIFDTYCGVTTWNDVKELFPEIYFPNTVDEF